MPHLTKNIPMLECFAKMTIWLCLCFLVHIEALVLPCQTVRAGFSKWSMQKLKATHTCRISSFNLSDNRNSGRAFFSNNPSHEGLHAHLQHQRDFGSRKSQRSTPRGAIDLSFIANQVLNWGGWVGTRLQPGNRRSGIHKPLNSVFELSDAEIHRVRPSVRPGRMRPARPAADCPLEGEKENGENGLGSEPTSSLETYGIDHSHIHFEVEHGLNVLGLLTRTDFTLHHGEAYPDIFLLGHRDGALEPCKDVDSGSDDGAGGVIVEVLDERCYSAGTRQLSDYARAKLSVLRRRGWDVTVIPYWQWAACQTEAAQLAFLAVRLARLGVLPAATEITASGESDQGPADQALATSSETTAAVAARVD